MHQLEGERGKPLSNFAFASLLDFGREEGLVGQVDLCADHLLSQAGERLHGGFLAELDGEGGKGSGEEEFSFIVAPAQQLVDHGLALQVGGGVGGGTVVHRSSQSHSAEGNW